MKVMFIASENNLYSGAFLSLVKLIVLLRDNHGIEPVVILPYRDVGKLLLEENNIKYYTIRSCNWVEPLQPQNKLLNFVKKNMEIIFNFIPIIRIAICAKKEKVDIIHTNSTYSYVGSISGFLCKIPVVWHLREFLEEDQNNKIWYRKLGYTIINHANCIITISEALKNKYISIFDNHKLKMIYNGLDEKVFYRNIHDIKKQENMQCVCVGGLYQNKGHDVILQAISLLKKKNKKIKISIIGDGAYRSNLEKMSKELDVQDLVEFCGFHRDVVPYYERASVAIVPSYSEAFGRVTVEAMMQGLVVVGANSGATGELLQNGRYGVVFENKSPHSLAEKLENIFDNYDSVQKIASFGQKYAMDNFTSEINAKNIYNVYEELV